MKNVTPFLVLCFGLFYSVSICLAQQVHSYTAFDVPNASATYPLSINDNGDVAGAYCPEAFCSSNGVLRGFVREFNGNITTFAGVPLSINDAGTVTGFLYDAVGFHSFIRDRSGNTTLFDIPSNPPDLGSSVAIDNKGEIAGYILHCVFCDLYFGFVRNKKGTLTTWEAGGVPTSINARGDVTGNTNNFNLQSKGFVRDRNGNLTIFEAPGANCIGGLFPNAINNQGTVTGSFSALSAPPQCKRRGFIRTPDGAFTAFDAAPDVDTLVFDINSQGDVVGVAGFNGRLFLRQSDGTITFFDVPVTLAKIGASQSRRNLMLNNRGDIAGSFQDYDISRGYITHGFVLSVRQ